MANKAEHDNDIVEYVEDGQKCWAARGSRAYQNRNDIRSPRPVAEVAKARADDAGNAGVTQKP
ncbi:hypothetical protein [Rhodococcus sp. BE178]|uniref:hypothetical protein n=1 Tax=Rhodococcus sp. BE178 TaxID=2817737 RepID=UPI003D1A43FC